LYLCKVLCRQARGCAGIEYQASGRCKVWTKAIGSTVPANGSACLGFARPASSSLFCVSVVMPWSREPELLLVQLQTGTGIFACDEPAIYSNPQISVGAFQTRLVPVDLHCKVGGAFHTVLNTPIFVKLWEQVIADGQFRNHDWAVKTDPDVVFLPARLQTVLRPLSAQANSGRGAFLVNCRFGMRGSVEVVSRQAVEVWGREHTACGLQPPQEDYFLQKCMLRSGVRQIHALSLVADSTCGSFDANCTGGRPAFHAFKDPESYRRCVSGALGGTR